MYRNPLSEQEIAQLKQEAEQLVERGMIVADVRKYLMKRWDKSYSMIQQHTAHLKPVSRMIAPLDLQQFETREPQIFPKPVEFPIPESSAIPENIILEPLPPTPVKVSINDVPEGDERIVELIRAEREAKKWKEEAANLAKRIKTLERDIDEKDTALQISDEIKANIRPRSIEMPAPSQDGEAVAVVVASDWHYGAIIRPNTVNGLNEVNPDITTARIDRFFQAVVKLLKKEQSHVTINKMVLAIIGDLIENGLHDELIEEATLSPIEQMVGVQDCVIGGIEYLLKHTELQEIVIPTCPGNHGRTTDKMRAATNYKNSYEQLIYWNLVKYFQHEPRVSIQVSDSYFNYIDVYEHRLRFHHGDACKFGGGIGGLMIPLRKFIHRANQQVYADTSICGHFHSLICDYDIMVNGSLVGPSAYSMRFGFPPERPQQILRLLDSKRSWTMFAPILVAEQEKKSGKIIG